MSSSRIHPTCLQMLVTFLSGLLCIDQSTNFKSIPIVQLFLPGLLDELLINVNFIVLQPVVLGFLII